MGDFRFGLAMLSMPVGQSSLFKQFSQSGPTGTQICWPNPTSNQLISVHLDWGNHSSKAFLVSSGVFVPLGPVHPNRLLIRWTWVSTPVMIKGHFSFQGRTHKLVIHQGFGHRPPKRLTYSALFLPCYIHADVSHLWPHTGQLAEPFHSVWDVAIIISLQYLGSLFKVFHFRLWRQECF